MRIPPLPEERGRLVRRKTKIGDGRRLDPTTPERRPQRSGSALAGGPLVAVKNDRDARTIGLRFRLPPDAGIPEAVFHIAEATHLLTFACLPPVAPLPAEDALASVGDWARQGMIVGCDPNATGTALVVARAHLHVLEEATTLTVEGHGEDADVLVWWEVRASGRAIEAM